ncbi:restriction endonuclease subunit S [Gardnerella pickettii]|uniref:Type I restriction modification DNA specificity domain protein n=1 Tax=Gardnerella pickettii JCP7719 TaxID=1261061 RepID=S4GX52_9BIFI|nr:restriction endonuclease subunit S [Gardnerella pickettii]EPI50485.1 type I restriction modification DNA specificity domain protein [Gardnerella pickettii JCP7719]
MKYKLSDICEYAKEKIKISALDENTYISTENMLPNKSGITQAASIPTQEQTQAFVKNDVLVSNIRPYFKKIWYATFDGGCSNDVLVFRAKGGINSQFLHYALADDSFFNYAMSTSRGTKMPRGDKKAIMEYEVPKFSYEDQNKVVNILKSLDDKIELNNKINKNLEEQVSILYQSWFEDFEITNGVCPKTWCYQELSMIADIASGKRPPLKSDTCNEKTPISIVGATSVMGFTSEANHTDKILVTGRVGTHGVIQRFNIPCWTSDNTLVITSPYYEFTNQILHKIDYSSMNRGSTQPLITQGDLKKVVVLVPDEDTLAKFEEFAGSLMAKWEANNKENVKLASLRDFLLPKLMSEKIDVSNLNI